ncbi:MAG: DUF3987 domain-containing protein [Novosphingobium sp.]|uniref:DUF3987 domain-containing protein n=1 Tax=Novosphingobium sp. TaxID=1874826 RepID=UPI00301AEAA2
MAQPPAPLQQKQKQEFNPLDLSILHGSRRKPPSFPNNVFHPALAKWCEDAARGAGAPLDYVVGTLLAVSGTLIGNARRISPKENWIEAAHLWGMLVGDPSAGKTPGMRPVLSLLDPIERERRKQFESELEAYDQAKVGADVAEAVWKAATKKAVEAGEPAPKKPKEAILPNYPILSRIKVNDATREKLALLASQNEKGLLFERDELAGWLNDFNRYGMDGGRQDWLMAYNGHPHRIDRIKHPEPIDIPRWSVGVVGGIQPERLVENILKEVDDGLSARFLYFWPDKLEPTWTAGVTLDETASRAMWRLSSLNLIRSGMGEAVPAVIPVSSSGVEIFSRWWEQHGRSLPTGSLLKGHYGKMPGMLLRLALILEYLWWAVDPDGMTFGDTVTEVSERSITSGITLIEEYFKPMALRIFQDAETPEGDRHAPALAHWILKNRPSRFNASNLRTGGGCPTGLREPKAMNAACETLRDYGLIRFVGERQDGKPGRKSIDWEVNPLVYSTSN